MKSINLKNKNIFINPTSSFSRSTFGKFTKLYENVQFNDSSLGSFSYINTNCILNNVQIGKFTSIAPYTTVIYGQHPTHFVSTHPIFYSTREQCGTTFTDKQLYEEFNYVKGAKKSVIIGNDVWIGYGVKIVEGITIEDGAVILAGSLVTKDVESYSMVGGIPAKHIKYRFTQEIIIRLKDVKWWDEDIEWIKKNANKFNDINLFIKKINEELI